MYIMTDSVGAGRSVPVAKKPAASCIAELQGQYDGEVLALVVRDLEPVDPKAGEGAVSTVVAEVWKQAEEHLKSGRTGWAHLSWFVQSAIAQFAAQTAGC